GGWISLRVEHADRRSVPGRLRDRTLDRREYGQTEVQAANILCTDDDRACLRKVALRLQRACTGDVVVHLRAKAVCQRQQLVAAGWHGREAVAAERVGDAVVQLRSRAL